MAGKPAARSELSIGLYDLWTDTIVIEGRKYSGAFFRQLGWPAQVGHVFRIDSIGRDGVLTLTRLPDLEKKSAA